jgi:hypothetical protein
MICFSIAVVQSSFPTTRVLIAKSNLLKARVIIYAYNQHVRLLPPEQKEGQRKRGTTRRSPRRSVHSEGIWYEPRSGEIRMCLRVGRMGPDK